MFSAAKRSLAALLIFALLVSLGAAELPEEKPPVFPLGVLSNKNFAGRLRMKKESRTLASAEDEDPRPMLDLAITREGLDLRVVMLASGELTLNLTHNNETIDILSTKTGELSLDNTADGFRIKGVDSGFALLEDGSVELLDNYAGSLLDYQHPENTTFRATRSWFKTFTTLNYTAAGINMFSLSHTPYEELHGRDEMAGLEFNHDFNGQDWPQEFKTCSLPQQSPINLMPPVTSYGPSYIFYDFAVDDLKAEYADLSEVSVDSLNQFQTIEFVVSHDLGYMGFSSQLTKAIFNVPAKWDAFEVMIHHNSEHTIDRKRYDLEFQIYHQAHAAEVIQMKQEALQVGRRLQESELSESEQMQALSDLADLKIDTVVVAIMFDSKDFNSTLSPEEVQMFYDFFDEMNLEDGHSVADSLSFSTMMQSVDWSNRWIYKGSNTLPPCHQYVLWNVIQMVYPIREDQVALIHQKMENMGVNFENGIGNDREIQIGLNREVYFIRSLAAGLSTAAFLALLFAYF